MHRRVGLLVLLSAASTDAFSLQGQRARLVGPSRRTARGSAITLSTETAAASAATASATADSDAPPTVVVVGGGWGGWGAAKALCEAGCRVKLIDVIPDPTGATPYLSSTGKPVEAGTRGFWKDYPNIEAMTSELGLDEAEVWTDFTNSSFYSPDGLEATAPVFSLATLPTLSLPSAVEDLLPASITDQIKDLTGGGVPLPELPSPFGQVLATFPLFERIPLSDRASMAGLLLATLDALGGSEETMEAYDRMTAHELFIRFGLSKRLVEDFVKPTLLVGLFKPPEELSALVVMELLYFYALAHQDSFDVRWIRKGTVASQLIAPMAERLINDYDLEVIGGARVTEIHVEGGDGAGEERVTKVDYVRGWGDAAVTSSVSDVDGVILGLGAKGMKAVVGASPGLAKFEEFSKAASLGGVDVISVRLWLDRKVKTRTPANVFSRFPSLRGAGGTFFMLDQLQVGDSGYTRATTEAEADADAAALWGVEVDDPSVYPGSHKDRGSVVACDFYNANGLLALDDEALIRTLTDDLLPSAVPAFGDAKLLDSWVARYPGAVSWFSPGSYTCRPPLEGAGVDKLPNLKCAGDWVRMGEREHGAKGLCQERAFVSGLEACNALLDSLAKEGVSAAKTAKRHVVIPVRDDQPQVKVGRQVSQNLFSVLPRFWVR